MFRLRSPLYAQIELTSSCNLGCSHCYNEERFLEGRLIKPIRENLPTENFPAIARELVRNDVFATTLTGGEPLKTRDRLYQTAEVLAQENLDVTLNSNLTLLTEDDAQRLTDSGITGIMTSLFSNNPKTHDRITGIKGSHRRTLRGLGLLAKQNIPVAVNMVVSQHNRDHVYDTGIFVNSLGADSFQSAQAIPSNSGGLKHLEHSLTMENLLQYLEELHRVRQDTGMFVKLTNPIPYCLVWNDKPYLRYLAETSTCTGGRTIIQVSPEGEVKPCPMVDVSYGNILEEGLDVVWERMGEWSKDRYVPNECKPCDLTEICRGSCRAEAQRMMGSLDSQSPFSTEPITGSSTVIPSLPKGTELIPLQELKAREEYPGLYTLFTRDRYLVVPEVSARFISAIKRKGSLTIDEQVTGNPEVLKLVTSAYNAGILRKAA